MVAKDLYKSPTMTVVEIKIVGVVCASTMNVLLLTDPRGDEIDWGRSTYGSPETDTWN